MNSGTARTGVHGFKLESLMKLMDVKATTDKDLTLMHYLMHVVETSFPQFLTFIDEHHIIAEGAKGILRV